MVVPSYENLIDGQMVTAARTLDVVNPATEEQFGPVMPLMKFSPTEEAIERANASEYGLGGAVWTRDTDKGVEIAEQLETGTVWVDEFLHLSPLTPFGGHKQSGFGAEYGIHGLKAFPYSQVITVKREPALGH